MLIAAALARICTAMTVCGGGEGNSYYGARDGGNDGGHNGDGDGGGYGRVVAAVMVVAMAATPAVAMADQNGDSYDTCNSDNDTCCKL